MQLSHFVFYRDLNYVLKSFPSIALFLKVEDLQNFILFLCILVAQFATPFDHPAQGNASCHFPTCIDLRSRLGT